MLQGNFRGRRPLLRAAAIALACSVAMGADPPIAPVGVCDILRDLTHMDGKDVAVVGRYSFRADEGRWVGEQSCEPPAASPSELWLVEDAREAPKPPEPFEIDTPVLRKKLTDIERHTSLGKFRFGTPDYDRWAVVYGRVETRKGDDAKKAPANLRFRGSGVVVFVSAE